MTITFYDYQPAPNPRRARMVLAEKGIAHEARQIDMQQREQMTPEYRKINPGATIPALVLEDGTSFFENWGIAQWAEAFQPKPCLMGHTATEKGVIASWMSRVDFSGLTAFGEAFRNSAEMMKGRSLTGARNFEQLPALAERGIVRLGDFMTEMNERLEGREFIATDNFTTADIWAFSIIGVTPWIKMAPNEQDHPNLIRWSNAISERPSAKL